jgi:hypothetical protein
MIILKPRNIWNDTIKEKSSHLYSINHFTLIDQP